MKSFLPKFIDNRIKGKFIKSCHYKRKPCVSQTFDFFYYWVINKLIFSKIIHDCYFSTLISQKSFGHLVLSFALFSRQLKRLPHSFVGFSWCRVISTQQHSITSFIRLDTSLNAISLITFRNTSNYSLLERIIRPKCIIKVWKRIAYVLNS